MKWKIYFGVMVFITAFSAYYQFIITQEYGIKESISLVSDVLLLLGAYSYIFHKEIFSTKNWSYIYKALLLWIGLNLLYQVLPSSYVGNFSFLNGSLLTNIFVYLLILCLSLPLYYAVYQLTLKKTAPKKKK